MSKRKKLYSFDPDYAVHPGKTLKEIIKGKNVSQTDLAMSSGLSEKHISRIINGKENISASVAVQFERVLGIPAEFWNNLGSNYSLQKARLEEKSRLQENVSWAGKFPLKELTRRGYLNLGDSPAEKVGGLLNFFGAANDEAFSEKYQSYSQAVAYRKSPSFKGSEESVLAWLRIGELKAEQLETAPYDKDTFKEALRKIRRLTVVHIREAWPKAVELCREGGVALVCEPQLPKTHLSGAAWWPRPDKAVILLSLRQKKDDFFWFDFFHEAAHIIKHGKKDVYIDDENLSMNDMEKQANRFAEDMLIPRQEYRDFVRREMFSYGDSTCIEKFAKRIGVAPGIVVGRLQHDGIINWAWHNDLKRLIEIEGLRDRLED